ncbi:MULTISPECIES: hypothetical protein [unclassified Solwaraspora]|uniref:hypothetical protein n=1 Tax=unclassified Solwaraspora TaxID=2627926 RepID=UPI00259BE39C|nr:hypothetical protein [Solwaraspora sp. WMMA2056]WJK41063.1 hypothetical protein O7608_00970 [Solwaraspora sp. WMMA2056]
MSRPDWPDTPAPARADWRDTLRAATDLALLGIVAALAAAAVLTAGAAVATASTAIHRWTVDGHWPSLRELAGGFWRALLPGAAATAVAAVAIGVLGGNAVLISAGVVPGGTVMLVGTLVLAALVAGFAGLVVVEVGIGVGRAGAGWRAAVRRTWRLAERRPLAVLAAAGVVSLAALLSALTIPVLAPILLGYTLHGLHAVRRRLDPQQ